MPNGKAVRGHTHEYKRHGTTTLFAALEVHRGIAHVGHYRRKRRREFRDFINGVVAHYPDTELHVALDNFTTHRPKNDRWLRTHPLGRRASQPTARRKAPGPARGSDHPGASSSPVVAIGGKGCVCNPGPVAP